LSEVTPRHGRIPLPFPALNQKLGGRAKVSFGVELVGALLGIIHA
jgi:hypothetical protein